MNDYSKQIYLALREVIEEELMNEADVERYVAQMLNEKAPEAEAA